MKDAARRRDMALNCFTDDLLEMIPLPAEGDKSGICFVESGA
jgi:hypothetical protein